MDGICATCGLAYSPDDRECAQCGEEVGDGRKRRGFLRSLFGRRRRPSPPERPAVKRVTSHRVEIVDAGGQRRVYDRLEDVPAAERARLEQAQDLGEDLVERLGGAATHRTTETTAAVYTSLDEVPEDMRDRIRDALEMVEDMLDGDPGT